MRGRRTVLDDYLHDYLMEAATGKTNTECWEWNDTRSSKGYPVFYCEYKQYIATRIILGINDLNGLNHQACHTCDNPTCVNPRHLFAASARENQQDKGHKQRAARGERNASSKMTASKVVEARQRINAGESVKAIAAEYGVSDVALRNAYNRKTWAWV